MTYDELLAKIWILSADVTELQHGAKAVQALRAVVTLCNFLDQKGICCVPVQEVVDAIERELTRVN